VHYGYHAQKQSEVENHPGEILREEYLKPLRMSAAALARELHVSVPTVNDVVRERRAITAEMALRLARFFGTTEQFWLNLQDAYEARQQ
jgi:antitoxin HigA-1